MSKQIAYRSGALTGFRYVFDNAGDFIHEHKHRAEHLHNVICLCGLIEVKLPDRKVCLVPGEVFDFDGTQLHTITALKPGSVVLNLYLAGSPPSDFIPDYIGDF